MRVLILVDYFKEEAVNLIPELIRWFSEKNVLAIVQRGEEIGSLPKFNFAVLLGGDGFIMKTGLKLVSQKISFMGINFGTLGFLAVAEQNNWPDVLQKVIAGQYAIDKRLILDVVHISEAGVNNYEAIGDVYIRHAEAMVKVKVTVDGDLVHQNLRGDGVIIATPTGSTAYNLAAGGPIIESGIAITPICAHPVNKRPISVKEFREVEVTYLGTKSSRESEMGCFLFVDGQKYRLEAGDRVIIHKSPKKARFIVPKGFSVFDAIQKKLGLSG